MEAKEKLPSPPPRRTTREILQKVEEEQLDLLERENEMKNTKHTPSSSSVQTVVFADSETTKMSSPESVRNTSVSSPSRARRSTEDSERQRFTTQTSSIGISMTRDPASPEPIEKQKHETVRPPNLYRGVDASTFGRTTSYEQKPRYVPEIVNHQSDSDSTSVSEITSATSVSSMSSLHDIKIDTKIVDMRKGGVRKPSKSLQARMKTFLKNANAPKKKQQKQEIPVNYTPDHPSYKGESMNATPVPSKSPSNFGSSTGLSGIPSKLTSKSPILGRKELSVQYGSQKNVTTNNPRPNPEIKKAIDVEPENNQKPSKLQEILKRAELNNRELDDTPVYSNTFPRKKSLEQKKDPLATMPLQTSAAKPAIPQPIPVALPRLHTSSSDSTSSLTTTSGSEDSGIDQIEVKTPARNPLQVQAVENHVFVPFKPGSKTINQAKQITDSSTSFEANLKPKCDLPKPTPERKQSENLTCTSDNHSSTKNYSTDPPQIPNTHPAPIKQPRFRYYRPRMRRLPKSQMSQNYHRLDQNQQEEDKFTQTRKQLSPAATQIERKPSVILKNYKTKNSNPVSIYFFEMSEVLQTNVKVFCQ